MNKTKKTPCRILPFSLFALIIYNSDESEKNEKLMSMYNMDNAYPVSLVIIANQTLLLHFLFILFYFIKV